MSKKRFEVIYTQGTLELFKIIRDNETGVLYMQNHRGGGVGVGLTVMVDQKGNPLVDEGF
ncbi:hypothetical protein JOC34_003496 [Virgibacillus halotolerans]|uniref:DUF6440 family protein n=1 Tax=Virgibacillus halotolerans TaxID=1071053 RepID=UPI0019621660|nr:DUF6440 family protein [Virgibacillus halotolerans]MBM7601075.1 hypothetical protein [Virgibacillus halotolerans]